jgi:cytochrome P450
LTGTSSSTPVRLHSNGGHDLHALTDRLREAGSAVRVLLPENLTAWSVTRGDLVKKLVTHPNVSKDARKSWPGYQPGAIPWLTPWADVVNMFTSDGEDHKRLRGLIGQAFSPGRIQGLRPKIEKIVTELLDDLESHPADAPVDLRATYSYQLPTRLICDLFGVPTDQRPLMLRSVDALLDTTATMEQAHATRDGVYEAMRTLVAFKRETPGDDMTSHLIAARENDGDHLSEEELISTLLLMIAAGSETSVSLIDHTVRALLTHPEQLAAVLNDPKRWPDVLEESVRLQPPIMHLPLRYATADIDLGEGVTIRRGEPIIIGYGAHGRDPGVHQAREVFDIDRADKSHLAFGYGIHYCLGAPLGKLEAQSALSALFARFPDISLAVDPEQLQSQPSFIGNDYRALPVHLHKTA